MYTVLVTLIVLAALAMIGIVLIQESRPPTSLKKQHGDWLPPWSLSAWHAHISLHRQQPTCR